MINRIVSILLAGAASVTLTAQSSAPSDSSAVEWRRLDATVVNTLYLMMCAHGLSPDYDALRKLDRNSEVDETGLRRVMRLGERVGLPMKSYTCKPAELLKVRLPVAVCLNHHSGDVGRGRTMFLLCEASDQRVMLCHGIYGFHREMPMAMFRERWTGELLMRAPNRFHALWQLALAVPFGVGLWLTMRWRAARRTRTTFWRGLSHERATA